ncbi:hypothetical protein OE88DRAFT_1733368 [Heliocybe sulcata]|uniref:Uncharacterized protein n=1 Tax=Heliocybe sulcata TaxID=5364 RepID=A0A5C3NAF9_9AGAM|nr:hypothetical protein OE88DRAFT_1733368 [Heliocybe sulcata]
MALTQETREWAVRIAQDLNRAGVHSSVERVSAIGSDMEQVAICLGRESRDVEAQKRKDLQRLAADILGSVKSFKERVIPLLMTVTSLKTQLERAQEENARLSMGLAQVEYLRADHAHVHALVRHNEEIIAVLSKAVDDAKAETVTARQDKKGVDDELDKLKGQYATLERKVKSKETALEQVKLDFGKRIKSREEELEMVKGQRKALKDAEMKYKGKVDMMSRRIADLEDKLRLTESHSHSSTSSSSHPTVSQNVVDLDSDDDFDAAPLPTPPLSSDPAWPPQAEVRGAQIPVLPQKRKAADAGLPLALDRNGKLKGCVRLGSRRKW